MKYLKFFLSTTIPLVIMLFTFGIYLLVSSVVDSYKHTITDDYAIVVITNTPIVKIDNIADVKIKYIKAIEKKDIIKDVRDNLSNSAIKLLNDKLPYFYQIYLDEFPTTSKLEQIRKELITISSVKRVETFSDDHNKIYSLLILIQDIIVVLFIIVLMLSFILLYQQMKIWFFEQSERISIIQLHGGSLFYSSKPIIKSMGYSVVTAIVVVISILFLIISNISLVVRPEILPLIPTISNFKFDIIKIIVLAFVLPSITFSGFIIQHKTK